MPKRSPASEQAFGIVASGFWHESAGNFGWLAIGIITWAVGEFGWACVQLKRRITQLIKQRDPDAEAIGAIWQRFYDER